MLTGATGRPIRFASDMRKCSLTTKCGVTVRPPGAQKRLIWVQTKRFMIATEAPFISKITSSIQKRQRQISFEKSTGVDCFFTLSRRDISAREASLDARRNLLLAAFPAADWARWEPHLELVEMPLGMVLCESGDAASHVFFPTTAIVSLLNVLKNGASAEIAIVGNEGVVGVSLFLGGESTSSRSVVQSGGEGFRMKSQTIKEELIRAAPIRHLLLRYIRALIAQIGQTAVCNRHHSLDQQLCRWLLLSLDRLETNEILMTQELIANMLGVRREGVTEGAIRLQQAGVINYARGRITVLDRKRLARRSCECYALIKTEYERLLAQ